jgi:prepilin-type N-terminal cleavage/methylation domain-containing protein
MVRRARGTHESDAGMTLIELMWAMVIFAFVATATVGALEMALKTTRSDRSRVAASDLAARELEIVRNTFTGSASGPGLITDATNPDPLPGGTAGSPLVVDNVPYTVSRNTEWIIAGTGKSPCDGGATVTYPSMAVKISVTWSLMGNTQPVTAYTVLTPSKNWVSSTSNGYAAIKVLDSTASPVKNTQVTLTGPGGTMTDTTSDDGCAVFSTSSVGSWTASINQTGYVDFYGNQNATKNVTIAVGGLVQATINYDKAATATVQEATQAGYNLPTSLPWLTFANTGLQPTGTRYVQAAGATTTVTSLWPFTDGYTMWAGQCNQADPAASGGTRSPAVVMAPGSSNSASVTLTGTALTVRTAAGLPVTNATVTATPVSTTGCNSTENPLTLGVTNSSGQLMTSLPAGSWTLKVSGKSPSGSWPSTAVLLPTSSPIAMTVTTT